jgi:Protein of unknown function (DUF1460)
MAVAADIGEASRGSTSASASLDARQIELMKQALLDPEQIAPLLAKPLYKFSEAEVDLYLPYVQAIEPDLRKRIVHLARKNIGQPYELFLLGEMPFEPYDPQPLYCLGKSDCVVFAEHTYAMALARDWPSFMAMLQRIRYRDGRIGVATRNHYTEADWNVSNRWLVHDVTSDLAGDKAAKFEQKIDRAAFLKNRYDLKVEIAVEQHEDVYIPLSAMTLIEARLEDGDFVNVVRGVIKKEEKKQDDGSKKLVETIDAVGVGHVGLVVNGPDGTVNMIHSAEPEVREEPIVDFIARSKEQRAEKTKEGKPVLLGFKFLRLEADPLANLRKIDGDDAPRVTLPRGGQAKF